MGKQYKCEHCVEFHLTDDGDGYCKLAEILINAREDACNNFVNESNDTYYYE